jgi:hypothetical protein
LSHQFLDIEALASDDHSSSTDEDEGESDGPLSTFSDGLLLAHILLNP